MLLMEGEGEEEEEEKEEGREEGRGRGINLVMTPPVGKASYKVH